MLYSELAKTYRKLFKKYPNISSLQDFGGKILEEKTTYAKRGTRWVELKRFKPKRPGLGRPLGIASRR